MKNLCLLVCLVCVSILWAADVPKQQTVERFLATVPISNIPQLRILKQGDAVLYPINLGTTQFLAVNENLGSAFDSINADSLQVSADGDHYAAVASVKGKQCVIVDGKAGELYASILPESLRLGDRGEYVEYIARETNGQARQVLIDLDEGKIYLSTAFDEVRPGSAIISSTGTASAYVARIGKQWCTVVFDKPGKLYDDIKNATFSQDGKHLYFTALVGGKWKLVSPRTSSGFLYDYDEIGPIVVSQDNLAVMYSVCSGNRWNIIRYAEMVFPKDVTDLPVFGVDGKERYRLKNIPKLKRPPLEQAIAQQPFDAVGGYGFLADGTFVYTAKRGTEWSLVCGDTIDGPYESMGAPVFIAKGNRVLCTAKRDGQWFFLAGDKRYGPYEAIGAISLSPIGDHIAYMAKKQNGWCVSVDGIDGEVYAAVDAPVWSPDGTQMAYVAKKGGQYGIVQNGKLVELYDAVSQPTFSRSGRHLCFAAQSAGKWRMIVGKAVGMPYDLILNQGFMIDQESEQPQTTKMGTVYTPLAFHYLAARLSTKKINNEDAFDVYSVKEIKFE